MASRKAVIDSAIVGVALATAIVAGLDGIRSKPAPAPTPIQETQAAAEQPIPADVVNKGFTELAQDSTPNVLPAPAVTDANTVPVTGTITFQTTPTPKPKPKPKPKHPIITKVETGVAGVEADLSPPVAESEVVKVFHEIGRDFWQAVHCIDPHVDVWP